MELNGLLGSNDSFSSNFEGVAAAGVWMIVSVVLAIIGGIGCMISSHLKKCC